MEEKEKIAKLLKFIEGVKEHTDDFDKMCDCSLQRELKDIIEHDDNCMTMNFRKDYANIIA